ncbi:arginine--tRNA ligase [Roseburia inulinivorans DSM 16841]|uniref:Arginine--tRNA ligase n=1 Tax=Roseburia inulinivorans DSM 16841 TaxID=622312 RepID=C0FR76_9FIRM|nr:arginine--tRNA ligase [Roseburia inulinivorans]EEG94938.1 arginine--tRNA ligase [Roseburia inulinivorans DSM 16841]MCC3343782.1 arginine--tRNA ligase [Roseburia inulinivorans DSM 16841]
MKKILDLITDEVTKAFTECGYDAKYAKVTLSNRPDLCEYQCNGAMAAAKEYKKAPFMIADEVVEKLAANPIFAMAESVKPGFLNLKIDEAYLADYVAKMQEDEGRFGCEKTEAPKTIMIDYGGPNVAKPLHVGHLRSAIIGESVKRIGKFMGHNVIGDVHLGDWGLQMGLIITELKLRRPELVYFDDAHTGEYPEEAPFTISELEEIYPTASKKSKEDEAYKEAAMQATFELQHGKRGYQALLKHILNVSVTDLKRNYANLNVSFELWKGESDAQPYIPDMVQKMKDDGFAYISDGALVVDVKEDTDTKEIPPCMILKSDGASLYNTTDLATMVWRMKDYNPDEIIYVVDKRQELYFTQVFRCARKTGIVKPETELKFLGFGTMNGKDGRPFKTRDGGVMRLEHLISGINEEMLAKIQENQKTKENLGISTEEAENTAKMVALAAIKYGDLSNQASKDYIFDIDRFTSFEGNTGPYILYTIVRIKSILNKYHGLGKDDSGAVIESAHSKSEKDLMLELSKFNAVMESAFEETAPHKICSYIYDLANAFNSFYHGTKIMSEENETVQKSYIRLLELTKSVLETCIDVLGFSAPERM